MNHLYLVPLPLTSKSTNKLTTSRETAEITSFDSVIALQHIICSFSSHFTCRWMQLAIYVIYKVVPSWYC
uniref:Uncharacterized protein n=1 Tax=Aegilops tauschii subsp. strangulata TaxID=200361 RepID=A0A453MPQ7_AEGTS